MLYWAELDFLKLGRILIQQIFIFQKGGIFYETSI